MSVFSSVSSANPSNPDAWSYRKVAGKSAEKEEHHGGSAKKMEKKLDSKPFKLNIFKNLGRAAKHANNNNNNNDPGNQNNGNQNRVSQDLKRAMKEVADADRYLPANRRYHIQGRASGFVLRRDLDDEEVFGREYDLLDERDTFEDLD